jgi:predicted transcriptional regulator
MKAILLSIRPEWCDLIVRGKKTIEVRKTRPKLDSPFKAYIYCTKAPQQLITIFKDGEETMDGEIHHGKPVFVKFNKLLPDSIRGNTQMVIGEFICDDIRRISPEYCIFKEDIETAIAGSCLSIKQVREYAGWGIGMKYTDMKDLYSWHISDLKIYDRPRPLSDFKRLRATKFGYEPVDIERPPQSWCYVEEAHEWRNDCTE